MSNFRLDSHHATRGFDPLEVLRRENADLKQRVAVLSSQTSDRLTFEQPALFFGEARYRALIELSPQVIWMANDAGKIIYTNRFWHQYSGLPVGANVLSVLHPDDAEHALSQWHISVQDGIPFDHEARIRRASDGQYRWHLTKALPLKNADGQVLKWVGISIDVHDRKMAAAVLAESDERVRIAVEAAGMGTWDYYPETNETKWSARSKEIFGLASDEGMNLQGFLQRVHPDDQARVAARIQEAKDPLIANEYDVDYRIVMPDGTIRWVTARGKCFFSGSGPTRKATRFSGVILDITERKQAEQERARLTTMVENSPDFIGMSDLQGKVLFVNRAGRKLVGLPDRAETTCKSINDFVPAEDRAVLDGEIIPAIQSGKVWEGEVRLINFETGKPILTEVRAFGISGESGSLTNLATIARDISARKRMEAQLALAQKMDVLGKLSCGIAHDFGNLLTIIKGYGEILRDRSQDDADTSRIVKEICSAATKAAVLTSRLLAFGRRQILQPSAVDLSQAVTRVLDMLRRLVGEDIAIETQLENDLWQVKIDPGQVDQILINLAANARDAMPDGGAISIKVQNCRLDASAATEHSFFAGDYVKLSFSDTGVGMDAEIMSRVFEPFFTTKETGKGTGLGLATVHGILQQVRGQISVSSEPGGGATFTLYFPRSTDISVESAPSPEAERLRGTERILLVEDEQGVRDMLADCLRTAGYSLHTAKNGQEALGIAQNQSIDLLITDVVMPGGGGRDLALSVGKIHPGIGILFISGYVERTALQEALRQPGTSFVPKPFSLKEVLIAIRRALDASASRVSRP